MSSEKLKNVHLFLAYDIFALKLLSIFVRISLFPISFKMSQCMRFPCGILTCVDPDEPLQLLSLETQNGVQSVA